MATLHVISLFDPAEQLATLTDTTRIAVAVPAGGPSDPAEIKAISHANYLAQLRSEIMGGGTLNIGISHDTSLFGTEASQITEGGTGQTVSVVNPGSAGHAVSMVGNGYLVPVFVPAAGPGQPAQIRYITFLNFLNQILQAVPSGGGGSGNVTISADTEVPGTVASEVTDGGIAPPTFTRYIAISADDTFDGAEFLAGHASNNNSLVVPHWSGGRRYIALAVPEDRGDINVITTGGINISMAFMRIPGTIDINGVAYKAWRTINDQADNAAGVVYSFTQV